MAYEIFYTLSPAERVARFRQIADEVRADGSEPNLGEDEKKLKARLRDDPLPRDPAQSEPFEESQGDLLFRYRIDGDLKRVIIEAIERQTPIERWLH